MHSVNTVINLNDNCDRTRQIESLVGEFHYELRAITTVHWHNFEIEFPPENDS